MLRFETAGESHGECLVATLTGLPAGIPISVEAVNRELWRRQQGYGRGGRMKIETDRAEIVAGVRHSRTIGSPIAILIRNRDWKNWTEALPVEDAGGTEDKRKPVTRPAPGPCRSGGRHQVQFPRRALHSGARQRPRDGRARGRRRPRQGAAGRVRHRGAEPRDRGGSGASRTRRPDGTKSPLSAGKTEILLGCVDAEAEARMKEVVDEAYRTGDTVGGVFEVVAHGVPPGLGSHVTWDSRLDGRLAQAIVSMQAVKGVEIGFAAEGAASFGSKVQDTIHYDREERRFTRGANRAGGLEGGITNGQDVVVRGLAEAHFHAAPAARIGGSGHARAGAGGL